MMPAPNATAPRPSPPWPRRVAFIALGWGVFEVGTLVKEFVSTFLPHGHALARALALLMLVCSGLTLVLPAGLLLSRRRVRPALCVLAALPPALCALVCLGILVLILVARNEGEQNAWYVFLALALVRIALVAALVSTARGATRGRGDTGLDRGVHGG